MKSFGEIDKTEINKIELKNIFKNWKSDYFLQKLFNHLSKKKSLEIIKYNKSLKDKINISIVDYKEYSEIYSSIEIELKPAKNKYGNFININKENEKYFHIYFNDKKPEIKRNYLQQNENISKIKIIIDYHIKSFEGLFHYCKCLEYINFKKFYRNNITQMKCMFQFCSSLKELNLSNNSTHITSMFCRCSKQFKNKIKDKYKNIKNDAFIDSFNQKLSNI